MSRLCQDSEFGYDITMRERMHLVKQAGFDSTALSWTNEQISGKRTKVEPYLQHHEIAREEGLYVDNIHCEYVTADALWGEGSETEAYLSVIESTIRECGRAGIGIIIFHPANGTVGGVICKKGLDRFKRLTALAEDNNVKIAVENIRNGEHLNFLLSNVPSQNVGFCYDIGHQNCFAHYAEFLPLFGSRLLAVHLHDNFGVKDEHFLPFDGNIDWYKFYSQMRSLDYKGAIELESMSHSYKNNEFPTPEAYLEESFRRVKIIQQNLEK